MLNLLVRYRILTNRGSGIVADNYINVYWDDVANGVEVQKFDNASDTTGTVITIGPDLGAKDYDFSIISGLEDPSSFFTYLQYRFCDGSTLNLFHTQSLFPYVNKVTSPNHFSCASTPVVCDLQISDDFTIQQASDLVTADGAISVSATSSNGTIKFSLNPSFDYGTQGQEPGVFSGLYAGEYTITAKDAAGCIDQLTLTISVPDFYNTRYRLDYTDINDIPTRVDVLERGYEGAITEVIGDGDPFILKYNGDGEIDKFSPIIPSEAQLTLMSQTNFQFRALFSQDERKYQIRYYKNYGNATGGFTPDTLDTLDLWTNVGSGDVDWTITSQPTITLGDGEDSKLLHTSYTFESGREYTFAYTFSRGTNASFLMIIRIVDSSYNTLLTQFVDVSVSPKSGEYTFVAPSGAAGITISVPALHGTNTYNVLSFTDETESASPSSGDYELKWIGYLISSNYSEAYLAAPYPVTIVATDGLADLKNYDYLDKDENKYRDDQITIKAIAEVLSKTDLNINIQCAINRFEEDMSTTASDDPLVQCKFDPNTFYHEGEISKCSDVLSEILKPFGARILQRNGKWCIYSVEEFVTSAAYREFTSNGLLITNGTIDDVVDIDVPIIQQRSAFRNRDQVLAMTPSYGKLFFGHTLLKNASLVKSYSFEQEDVYADAEGKTQFKNWTANISNTPGVTYGIKETKALQGDFNFYLWAIDGVASGNTFTLKTISFDIEFDANDIFELSFDYSVLLLLTSSIPYWVRIKWKFQIGSWWYNEYEGWTTDPANDEYNSIYNSNFNSNQNFKIRAPFRNVVSTTTESAFLEIVLEGANVRDLEISTGPSYAALKSQSTTNRKEGFQLRTYYIAEYPNSVAHWYYKLYSGDEAESLPEIVTPDDFHSTENIKYWKLERVEAIRNSVEYIYIDNVLLNHYPKGFEPPSNVTIEKNNNRNIKLDFDKKYLLNDIDIENINNSERTYKNYFKKLDGTPTQVWERTYRAGSGKLLELLANDVTSQYKRGSNKLTGSIISDIEVLPTSVMNEVNDGDRKYMFMGYELHDKTASIGFDLLEIQDTITDDGSEDIDAGFTTGFSLGFRS